jgi:phosphoribosyl-ATP pyrophosphohydrolase/phosphoribosyl-AMP cyclohydrolase/histidinol dehydrogenase
LDQEQTDVMVDADVAAELIPEFIGSQSRSDRPDQLIPTVVCDVDGVALGLAYSNRQSLFAAIETKRGVYWSRSRNELWKKGESSGATQSLRRIDLDCDQDTLRFTVEQSEPGFCHLDRRNCFSGNAQSLSDIERHLNMRIRETDGSSYTARLLNDATLLNAKIREEADELCRTENDSQAVWEAADLLYFLLVKIASHHASSVEVIDELLRRSKKVSRRPGNSKQEFTK